MRKVFVLVLGIFFPTLALAGTFQATCSTTSSVVVPANSARQRILIKNTSSQAAIICYQDPCTAATGYTLGQNEVLDSVHSRGTPITCITGGSTATLNMVEE
jgi:hypothetical protein